MKKYEVVLTDFLGRSIDFGVQAEDAYLAMEYARVWMLENMTDYHIDAVTGIAIYEVG